MPLFLVTQRDRHDKPLAHDMPATLLATSRLVEKGVG